MQQLTVSSLVRYLKYKLDTDEKLQRILVSGEISNYHRHYSGHLYFTLKDKTASINCVMFKTYASNLSFEPKTGDKVVITANTSIFETTGQLQLYVTKISLDGLGELYARYEALKNKLESNGYFDDVNKISLDKTYLNNVAVIVGDKSAAMSDIKTTFVRRWPLCNVDYFPTLVQGEEAPNQIIETLKKVDELNYDAIILARGGGSFEDLFCFNDENLVKCIYNLKTFIITGIGHEQDFTLADFVADRRAATPTASVELITPNIVDVIDELNRIQDCLNSLLERKLNNYKMNFDYYLNSLVNYQKHIDNIKLQISNIQIRITNIIENILENRKLNYKRYSTLLEAYSHQNTLKRGYTIVIQNRKVIKSINDLKKEEFQIKFKDGLIEAKEV